MARYYTDVMIFNVIRNAKQQPNGLQIDDMKRILNSKVQIISFPYKI